jgi:hypothetical protein
MKRAIWILLCSACIATAQASMRLTLDERPRLADAKMRFQRSVPVPACEVVRDVLSRIQNSPLIGQGLAGITGCAAARARTDRSYPTSRRSPSPVRTARSLKLLSRFPCATGTSVNRIDLLRGDPRLGRDGT